MKTNLLELLSLTLRNFKGIYERTFQFDGHSATVYGANESGKSTAFTAYMWLLTGKDEFDRKDYEIKNTKRKELNAQAHEVEGIFRHNGEIVKLKRVYLEKWTKPKGQSQKVFDGHTTEFWINDAPAKPSEYQSQVDLMTPPKYIKLITNPAFFLNLDWPKQREGLLSIAAPITNEQILDCIRTVANDYGALINVLNSNKSLERYSSELKAKRKLLEDKAIQYPSRIDEVKRSKPEELDWSEIETNINVKERRIKKIDALLSDESEKLKEQQKNVLSIQSQVFEKEAELNAVRLSIETTIKIDRSQFDQEITATLKDIANKTATITSLRKQLTANAQNKTAYTEQLQAKQAQIDACREKWNQINAEKFEFDEDKCECPTCKQKLPANDIEAQRTEMLKNFNDSVATRKQEQVRISNQYKTELCQIQQKIDAIEADTEISSEIKQHEESVSKLEENLKTLKQKKDNASILPLSEAVNDELSVDQNAIELMGEIDTLKSELEAAKKASDNEIESSTLKEERLRLNSELNGLKKDLLIKDTIEKADKRLKELLTEEELNAQEKADIEKLEQEIVDFNRAKMAMLEESVNMLFRYVKFRLFDTQVNGEIVDACICEYNGVPYKTLNTAARMLAGMDCLETFSKIYGYRAPVFVDNRESTTWLPPTESQIINLFVSEPDKVLRVEAA